MSIINSNLNDIRNVCNIEKFGTVNANDFPIITIPAGKWLVIAYVMTDSHTWLHCLKNGAMEVYAYACSAIGLASVNYTSSTSWKVTADSGSTNSLRIRMFILPMK